MRINIGEVTFNTEFAPKKFGSRTSFKISGGSFYQCKKEKHLLNMWKYFFSRSILLIESKQILSNANILISKVIIVIYL